jgi:prephenate dehydrogenase
VREVRSAAVVGLGLMGGSVARELSARGVRVLGHDRDPRALEAALRDGAVHAPLGPALEGVEEAELLVLAVPVDAAPEVLRAGRARLERARLVTDVGSTQRSVCAAAEALGLGGRFVASHPLAGDHRSGWEASRAGLFQEARVFLSPTPSTHAESLRLAVELWSALGARPEVMDAAEHDRRLAWSSHLPQCASSALALALDGAGVERGELGPGGRDTTRLAGSSPEMWAAILLDNAGHLGAALDALQARLAELREALERGDADGLRALFEHGRAWADRHP